MSLLIITNNMKCAGVYDEMRDLEVGGAEGDARELLGSTAEVEKKTFSKEEEEALLADSEGEGAGAGAEQGWDPDEEMKSDKEEERRREREAIG
jgi:hypothetical protein